MRADEGREILGLHDQRPDYLERDHSSRTDAYFQRGASPTSWPGPRAVTVRSLPFSSTRISTWPPRITIT